MPLRHIILKRYHKNIKYKSTKINVPPQRRCWVYRERLQKWKKKSSVLGHLLIVCKCSKNQRFFLIFSWNALYTLFNDKKGRTLYICFPYIWKRQLPKEGKQGQSSHSKVVNPVVFILCVEHWQLGWRGKGRDPYYSHKVFYLLKGNVIRQWRYVINILWVVFFFFFNTDSFQNTLRSILTFNMETLEHMLILACVHFFRIHLQVLEKRQYDLDQDRTFLGDRHVRMMPILTARPHSKLNFLSGQKLTIFP